MVNRTRGRVDLLRSHSLECFHSSLSTIHSNQQQWLCPEEPERPHQWAPVCWSSKKQPGRLQKSFGAFLSTKSPQAKICEENQPNQCQSVIDVSEAQPMPGCHPLSVWWVILILFPNTTCPLKRLLQQNGTCPLTRQLPETHHRTQWSLQWNQKFPLHSLLVEWEIMKIRCVLSRACNPSTW